MSGSPGPKPGPWSSAQTVCARCRVRTPSSAIRIFANRRLCPACHGELVAQGRPPGFPPGTSPQALHPSWSRLLARIAQFRLVLAILRCAVYFGAFAALGPGDAGGRSVLTAFLVGAYAADNLTWLFFRLADLSIRPASFPIEALLTLGGGVLLASWQGLIPYVSDFHVVALAFPAFLVVLAGKMLVRGMGKDERL